MFNTVTNGMRVIGLDHRTLYVNDAFCRLAGVDGEEALTQLCYEVFPGDARHTNGCSLVRIAKGEKQIVYDVEKARGDGQKRICIVSASPLLVMTFTDTTANGS